MWLSGWWPGFIWFSCGSGVVQLGFSLLWPDIWFSVGSVVCGFTVCGSVVVPLWFRLLWLDVVRLWCSCGSDECGCRFSFGSVMVNLVQVGSALG